MSADFNTAKWIAATDDPDIFQMRRNLAAWADREVVKLGEGLFKTLWSLGSEAERAEFLQCYAPEFRLVIDYQLARQ